MNSKSAFSTIDHQVDLCVVGGGTAGIAAAIAAARHGVNVFLMHDRPVLGGNASSECRVHICGADRHNSIPHMRETGILEELRMLNLQRNPGANFTIFDTLMYEMVKSEPNIELQLNCTCLDAAMEGDRMSSVTGWQLGSEMFHRVQARWFADCSGDGILAPLSNASFRMGREARDEYDESHAPEVADNRTMGHSIRYQVRRCDSPQTFIPPPWAYHFESCDDLPGGAKCHSGNPIGIGYWWIELGGENETNTITDTEHLRDELLKIAYGVWDHIKNHCHQHRHLAPFLELEWMNFLPAKRESRRYVAAHVLTQNDLEAEGRFEDTVAYGGWSMDDHDYTGFRVVGTGRPSSVFHKCPSPYGIPLRSLYSRQVPNLFFAGRNAGATHFANSSTRVMGTGMSMGQAVGTAVSLLKEQTLQTADELLPAIDKLQQRLLWDDCYLPRVPLDIPEATRSATLTASQGDPEPVRDGWGREIDGDPRAWLAGPEDWIAYEWQTPRTIKELTIAFDSAMGVDVQLSWSSHCVGTFLRELPDSLCQRYEIEVKQNNEWRPFHAEKDNIHRHRRHEIGIAVTGVRLRLIRFRGNVDAARLYTFAVSES